MRNFIRYLLLFIKLTTLGCFGLIMLSAIGITGFIGYEKVFGQNDKTNYSLNGVRCLEIENQFQTFSESSGLELPTNAQIIESCDDHSGFHWDGEYYLVFDTTSEEISKYLQITPWNNQWQKQPVPSEISSNTGLSNVFADVFESNDIWYAATGKDGAIPYHNGKLIVIDPKQNRVFYSQWDF